MDPTDFVISDETLGLLVIEQNDENSTDGEGSNEETASSQKTFSCKTCNLQFVKIIDYENHIKLCSHDMIAEPNNSCVRPVFNKNICSRNVITDTETNSCFTSCDIFNERSLKTHMGTHADNKQLIKIAKHNNQMRSPSLGTKVFVCSICNKHLPNNKRDLLVHMKNHNGEEQLINNIKNDSSDIKSDEVTTEAFICPICDGQFVDRTDLDLHMRIHISEDRLVCIQCNERFTCERDLEEHKINLGHFETDIEDEKPVVDQCIEQFPENEIVLTHSRIQTGEKLFACDQCTEKFNLPKNLQEHMRIHIDEKPCVFQQFGDQVTLGEISKLSKVDTGSKKHLPKNCIRNEVVQKNFGTYSDEDSTARYSRIQPRKNLFTCNQCPIQFQRIKSLEEHLRYHALSPAGEKVGVIQFSDQLMLNGKSEKRATKNSSDDHFTNTGPLTSTGRKAFTCDKCNKQFSRKFGLVQHMLCHSDERSFQCELCCKRFLRKEALTAHMKIHYDRKVNYCNHCDKRFFNVRSLQKHSEKFHTSEKKIASGQDSKPCAGNDDSKSDNGEEQLVCYQCNERFTCDRDLEEHKINLGHFETDIEDKKPVVDQFPENEIVLTHSRIQTGEKLFTCDQCNEKFNLPKNLQEHMRTHLDEKPCVFQQIGDQVTLGEISKLSKVDTGSKKHAGEKVGVIQFSDQLMLNGKSEKHATKNTSDDHFTNTGPLTSTGRKAFTCDKCNKQFFKKSSLDRHMLCHSDERSFQWELCRKRFRRKEALTAHMKIHYDRKVNCYERFHNVHSLQKDLETFHTSEKKIASGQDSKPCAGKDDSKSDNGEEPCQKPFSCKKCDEKFVAVVEYENHVRSHDGVAEEYDCPICARPFINKRSLDAHTWKVHTVEELMENARKEKEPIGSRSDGVVEKLFSCDQCNRRFIQVWELVDHVKENHNPENKYKCDRCNMTFSAKPKFEGHRRTHTGEKPFVCNQCNKAFGLKSSLGLHMKLHSDEMPFQCSECEQRFRWKYNMKSHIINIHGGEISYACNQCDIDFTRYKDYKYHMRIHSNEKPFICKVCEMKFKHKLSLTVHFRIHTGEKPYVCSVCSKGFRARAALKKHTRNHADERPYICDICGKAFKQRSALWLHKRRHTSQRGQPSECAVQYICSVCGKSLSQRHTLTTHMRIHTENYTENAIYEHDKKHKRERARWRRLKLPSSLTAMGLQTGDKSLLCSVCSLQFNSATIFKEHMMMHTGEKPYLCHVCSMQFTRSDNLSKHMINQHAREKTYRCSECYKKFPDEEVLKKHMENHTVEKTFVCKVCNRLFRQNAGLERHFLSAHSGQATVDKRANCLVCNKWFTEKKVLKTHMRIHTGEKPYVCKICNERFMYSGYLKNHAKIHTEESTSGIE